MICEGAQGLLLDEDHEFFPHVTRGKTGLTNVIEIAKKSGITDLKVIYVTRAYMTRHGAGPFPTEQLNLSYEDATNISNEFQGSLRFGYLDLDLLKESINADLAKAQTSSNDKINIQAGLAVTCLDQVSNDVKYVVDGEVSESSRNGLVSFIGEYIKPVWYTSYGPTSADVKDLKGN